MPLPGTVSSTEAQEIIEKIAKEYGWISRTAREQSYQEASDAIERLQIELGASARAYDLKPGHQDCFH
jgi:hypothetical protein